jgi:hypothetical protein
MTHIYQIDARYRIVYVEAEDINDAAGKFNNALKEKKVPLTDVKMNVVDELPKGAEFLR